MQSQGDDDLLNDLLVERSIEFVLVVLKGIPDQATRLLWVQAYLPRSCQMFDIEGDRG